MSGNIVRTHLGLATGRFLLFWKADCSVNASKSSGRCCAKYSCSIKAIVRDTYWFLPINPLGAIGTPFRIHGEWTEIINGTIHSEN